EVEVEVRPEVLVALDERRQAAGQLGGDLGQLGGVGGLDGLLGGQFLGQLVFGDDDGHGSPSCQFSVFSSQLPKGGCPLPGALPPAKGAARPLFAADYN